LRKGCPPKNYWERQPASHPNRDIAASVICDPDNQPLDVSLFIAKGTRYVFPAPTSAPTELLAATSDLFFHGAVTMSRLRLSKHPSTVAFQSQRS